MRVKLHNETIRIHYLLKGREKRREKRRVQVAICFASHWLKKWRKFFKPIVERGKCKRVIIFESHLKSTLKTHFPGISVTH